MSKFLVGEDVVVNSFGYGYVLETLRDGWIKVNLSNNQQLWFPEDQVQKASDWEVEAMEVIQTYPDPRDTASPVETMVDYMMNAIEQTTDMVNNPDHYNHGKVECIEYLKDNMPFEAYTGYLEGNCKKYLHRWRYKKKPLEDLRKAHWYLTRLISELDSE